ncbi:MAG: cytochrome c biogenesis protein CcsA [Coriobacteriia bacterium]|nr:cytochrome c biogenesis protein CcsA [Coriobacteriia bacterium]
MGFIGAMGLLLAFVASVASVALLIAGHVMTAKKKATDLALTLSWAGRVVVAVCFAALTVCCGVMVICFLSGDYTIQYVLDQHSRSTGVMGALFNIAGLWAGREGSLMFWSWLIALFALIVSVRRLEDLKPLDNMATLVLQLVLTAFLGVLLFSDANAPFSATDPSYFSADGTLTAAASVKGMNSLLEHWAMAIHPPLLFVGYAGLTVPFAYAVAALLCNDYSADWVRRSNRIAVVAWLFLTVGIGLGAVWAYVVLGWGGYWGWDPVENASLLPWLMGVALIHSMTMYAKRGQFKAWALVCACLTYGFVIVGTFISRSGLVQSVHAFEGDPVSLVLFGALILASVVLGVGGVLVRRRAIAASCAGAAGAGADGAAGAEAEEQSASLLTREDFYFFNNVFLTAATVLVTYFTVSSALPGFLPLGGQSLPAGAYNVLARPLGVVYLALMALCPLLAWGRTDLRGMLRHMRVPGAVAVVVFVLLMWFFATQLSPAYDASVAAGGSIAADLAEQGPAWYYKGLTVVGLAVASLLFANSLVMLGKGLRARRAVGIGGGVAHVAMGVILVGLIGSSMYVTQQTGYVEYDSKADTASETFVIKDYELMFTGSNIEQLDNGNVKYGVSFDVTKGGQPLGSVSPSVTLVMTTQQQQQNAAVISLPTEDLFVVYKGLSSTNGGLSMDVRVNPLISFVWVGFGLLVLGALIAAFGRRGRRAVPVKAAAQPAAGAGAADAVPAAAAEPASAGDAGDADRAE